MPARLQVALQEPLAQVLGQHFHHAAVECHVRVVRPERPGVGAGGHVEHRAQLVRLEFIGAEDPEVAVVGAAAHDLGEVEADLVERAVVGRAPFRGIHRDGRNCRVRQLQGPAHEATDGVVVHPQAQVARRREVEDVGRRPAVRVEELLGPVRAEPRLDDRQMGRIRPAVGRRDLVGPVRAFHGQAVHFLRAGPALRSAEHDHRPRGA